MFFSVHIHPTKTSLHKSVMVNFNGLPFFRADYHVLHDTRTDVFCETTLRDSVTK